MSQLGSPVSLSLGQMGSRWINDTQVRTGDWGIIECMTDCEFTTLTSGLKPDGNPVMAGTLNGKTLIAGQKIFGYFTAITLASGSVIAYDRNPS